MPGLGALDAKQLARVQGGLPALKLATAPQSSVKEEARGSGRVWVFYPPLATKAETQTLVAELKGKGFDSYIVKTEGEFSGHLSLGLFSKEAAAQALVARLKAAGYDKARSMPAASAASSPPSVSARWTRPRPTNCACCSNGCCPASRCAPAADREPEADRAVCLFFGPPCIDNTFPGCWTSASPPAACTANR
ncbi:SPOR domain-containing protein [Vogesella fluminis]|uniref:SPOR domain-containing protein n=1 Tax=Vogesella fluminis TaxID=1069161 RepID=UPI0036388DF6